MFEKAPPGHATHRAGADMSVTASFIASPGWLADLFAGQTRQHKSALGVDVIPKTGTRS